MTDRDRETLEERMLERHTEAGWGDAKGTICSCGDDRPCPEEADIRSLLERLEAAERKVSDYALCLTDARERYAADIVKLEDENERLRAEVSEQDMERRGQKARADEFWARIDRETLERLARTERAGYVTHEEANAIRSLLEDYDKQGRDLEDLMGQRDVVMRREAALQERLEAAEREPYRVVWEIVDKLGLNKGGGCPDSRIINEVDRLRTEVSHIEGGLETANNTNKRRGEENERLRARCTPTNPTDAEKTLLHWLHLSAEGDLEDAIRAVLQERNEDKSENERLRAALDATEPHQKLLLQRISQLEARIEAALAEIKRNRGQDMDEAGISLLLDRIEWALTGEGEK